VREGVLIRDLITREQIVPAAEVEALLDLRRLTEIGMPGSRPAS
jgi:fumarate hydratase class II/aspartate ammonia-lyase